ncbi:hypothetical protein N7645_15055 [Pseudomonas juntendi]|uniref:hypothetical protein n=1 Tax=Pseudomonas TaxID=286 RepID=UPI0012AD9701|nr:MULTISPECIES: hypothetical protein [Pseudomonas]MDG9918206.1 hypothetical protein [Pseudomonas juntendi]MDH0507654.1 hypothetical protein [Pseudomonas juntendi]MDH1044864.1 hypothetical protein [Pseudomonas juntendi]MRT62323.1 hypothetical protein [Pseudomonas sp. CAH-1]
MQAYIQALQLVKALEAQGLVSAIMPPSNFLLSDRLAGHQRSNAEQAMELYADVMRLAGWTTGALKLISFAATAALLVDLLLR